MLSVSLELIHCILLPLIDYLLILEAESPEAEGVDVAKVLKKVDEEREEKVWNSIF